MAPINMVLCATFFSFAVSKRRGTGKYWLHIALDSFAETLSLMATQTLNYLVSSARWPLATLIHATASNTCVFFSTFCIIPMLSIIVYTFFIHLDLFIYLRHSKLVLRTFYLHIKKKIYFILNKKKRFNKI